MMIAHVYDKTKLLESAHASKMAYYPPHRNKKDRVVRICKSNLHVCARRSVDNKITIAFKGTTTADEIVSFLKLKPQEFHFRDAVVRIHTGILNMFEGLEPDLRKYLYTFDAHDVTFTGHSQGGALAMLASAYFGDLSNRNFRITCHTFGAPRVGDQKFHAWGEAYVKEVVNVVNRFDTVPQLPLPLPGLGYADNPNLLVLGKAVGLDMACVLRSHDMDTYIQNLNDL